MPEGVEGFNLVAWPQREHRQTFKRAQETLEARGPMDFAHGSIGVAKFSVTSDKVTVYYVQGNYRLRKTPGGTVLKKLYQKREVIRMFYCST